MTDLQTRRAQGWVPDVSTFGARLALVRQRMGWTNIKEAALACAIAPQTWRMWEADKQEPRQLINACMKIAGVTGVDYRWLALGPVNQAPVASRDLDRVTAQYPVRPSLGERVVTRIPDGTTPGSSVRTNVRAMPLERVER